MKSEIIINKQNERKINKAQRKMLPFLFYVLGGLTQSFIGSARNGLFESRVQFLGSRRATRSDKHFV